MATKARSLFDTAIMRRALVDSFCKLDPRREIRNPVMFTVYVGSILTTGLWILSLNTAGEEPSWFIFGVSIWLWFTVLFANFAEAMAEGRGKAQADALRRARQEVPAKKFVRERDQPDAPPVVHGHAARRRGRRWPRPPTCAKATWSSSKPATTFRPTAKSSRASPRSTKARSPAKARR